MRWRGFARCSYSPIAPARSGLQSKLRLPWLGQLPVAYCSRRALAGLNPENPDRNNRPEHGEAGDCPARDVDRAIRFRSIDHRVAPVGHDSLHIASVRRSPPAAQGSNPCGSSSAMPRQHDCQKRTAPVWETEAVGLWRHVPGWAGTRPSKLKNKARDSCPEVQCP